MTISIENNEQKSEFIFAVLDLFTDYLVDNAERFQNVPIPKSGGWTEQNLKTLFPESDRKDMEWELDQLLKMWEKKNQ